MNPVNLPNKYALVALNAAKRAVDGEDPVVAWKDVAHDVFAGLPSSQRKGCPKSTFLGLAEAGRIKRVGAGKFTRSKENRRYGEAAVDLLLMDKTWSSQPRALWAAVAEVERPKKHNSQIDVVLALWNAGMFVGQ